MLIPFSDLVRKHALKVRGILHVGAHLCEEQQAYEAHGIRETIWLEANENLVKIQKDQGKNIYHILASDKDGLEVDFNLSNNGQSSSMLEFGVHQKYHPDVKFLGKIRMKTKRIDTLAKEQKWDMSKHNFLNVDVQGADLLAIKGMGSLLSGFDYVYVEVNTEQVYKGCAELPEMDGYLASQGFTRKELAMTDAKWGDAFYIRTTIPTSKELTAPERILFDVGAHRGNYADAHMSQFDKLVLVEPCHDLANFLREKYKGEPKVVVVEKVVSDEQKVRFYMCNVDTISTAAKAWVQNSRFSDKGFVWTPNDDLPTITMDQLISQYGAPSKTKVDVEGYESHVLKSLSKNVGPLSFEWAEEVREDIVACLYHLVSIGYKKFYIQDGDRYDFSPKPTDFQTIDQTVNKINLWQPTRKDAWGMIHSQ